MGNMQEVLDNVQKGREALAGAPIAAAQESRKEIGGKLHAIVAALGEVASDLAPVPAEIETSNNHWEAAHAGTSEAMQRFGAAAGHDSSGVLGGISHRAAVLESSVRHHHLTVASVEGKPTVEEALGHLSRAMELLQAVEDYCTPQEGTFQFQLAEQAGIVETAGNYQDVHGGNNS